MYHFTGVGFAVAFGLFFKFFLNGFLDFHQPLHTVFCLFETVVGAVFSVEQLRPYSLEDTVDGYPAGLGLPSRRGNGDFILCIGSLNGLMLVRCEAGVFIDVYDSIVFQIL